jgi:hypothetical protein
MFCDSVLSPEKSLYLYVSQRNSQTFSYVLWFSDNKAIQCCKLQNLNSRNILSLCSSKAPHFTVMSIAASHYDPACHITYLYMAQLSQITMQFGAGVCKAGALPPSVGANLMNCNIIQMCLPVTTADEVSLLQLFTIITWGCSTLTASRKYLHLLHSKLEYQDLHWLYWKGWTECFLAQHRFPIRYVNLFC